MSPSLPYLPTFQTFARANFFGLDVLSTSSPLYPHRGNDALFRRVVWEQLCYTRTLLTDEDELPAAYFQPLFEDLQARERVPGDGDVAGCGCEVVSC